ncbi:uncharacterized protein LOC134688468 [Mytilus trossulus]|uniref:uncharacterized protein LOC134688468 n=1 Tax=Mytilus trossulus TaxID=6551 RepID=UPI0030069442
MDFNNIDTIDGYAFQSFKRLRWLSMRQNHINIFSKIFDIALKSLLGLQHLDIRYNIDKTMDISKPMVYPYFENHPLITDLYMDIVENPVFKLSGFKNILELNTIKFARCFLKQMFNDTLVDLPSTITAIYFHECVGKLSIVEADFLKPFPLLQILNMDRVAIHLGDALKLLYPFTHARMTSIIFKQISPLVPKPVFITRVMIQYLMHVCVKTLVLAECEIVGYEKRSLLAFKFPECLENVVFSGNRFSLALGAHLRELIVFMRKAINVKFFDLSYNAINFNNIKYCNLDVLDNPSYAKEIYSKGCQIKSSTTNENEAYSPILEKGSNG